MKTEKLIQHWQIMKDLACDQNKIYEDHAYITKAM